MLYLTSPNEELEFVNDRFIPASLLAELELDETLSADVALRVLSRPLRIICYIFPAGN